MMAHERRGDWARALGLHLDLPIVWDRVNDRHETGLRCLQEGIDSGASHWLIVQDDAIVCRDLLAGLEVAAGAAGDRIIGLYLGNWRSENRWMAVAVRQARRRGIPWLAMPGPWWGVGIVVPTVHLPALTQWYAESTLLNYDRRIERWAASAGVECWYTMPSLVEHRSGEENPSLVEGRPSLNRRAQWFIGAEQSALSIDWTKDPMRPSNAVVWRHRVTGRELRVKPGSMQATRLELSGTWLPVEEGPSPVM